MATLLFITGTDTGVGKTIATALLAAAAGRAGASVAVYKPTQAGLEEDGGDIDTVRRLADPATVAEGIRLAFPMAPVAAAAREGAELPPAADHAVAIAALTRTHDLVLVEGAGGLLVQLDGDGATLADIAARTPVAGRFVVVCRAGLGTLNHTGLTLEALARREREVAGVIIGDWPREPTEIALSNRAHLEALEVPLLAAIPERVGQLRAELFGVGADAWLTPAGRAVLS